MGLIFHSEKPKSNLLREEESKSEPHNKNQVINNNKYIHPMQPKLNNLDYYIQEAPTNQPCIQNLAHQTPSIQPFHIKPNPENQKTNEIKTR